MKFTLSWLKDHLETTASLEEIKATLDRIGIEVESIDDPSAPLAKFTVARVLEAKQHPNADRLRVLQVEIEKGKPAMEVVCGAPNARAGLVGVFAPLGAYIPGTGITLEAKPVRGIVSNGMMLSEREMQLSEDHNGIVDLSESYASRVGERYIDVMSLGDPVIEVKLTPNRPDCTGVRGIARDLAAAGLGVLKPEKVLKGVEGSDPCPIDIKLIFDPKDAHTCPCFSGRVIKGIKNGPSPDWLQRRLKAIGARPINAVVDITNYLMYDRGRPLHVYDLNKLKGAIHARMAKAGEKVEALNDKIYVLDETMCVIADDNGAHDIGGIMGSNATGSDETTTDVLIECAYFDPVSIATTGRKLGLTSDARYRFERGVDPAFIEPGLDLATAMMIDIVGGTPTKKLVAGKPPLKSNVIDFDVGRVEKLAGMKLRADEILSTLDKLGFEVKQIEVCMEADRSIELSSTSTKNFKAGWFGQIDDQKRILDWIAEDACRLLPATWKVTAPSWRPDIDGAADLVEEVARIAGLENIPSVPLPRLGGVTKATLSESQKRVRRSRRTLAVRGMVEAITWSFVRNAEAKHFGGGADSLELANPISSEMTTMRPSLLPGLLAAVQRNRNRGFTDVALFEVGQAYRSDDEKGQFIAATGVRAGAAQLGGSGRHWRDAASDADVFDVKADVLAVLASVGFDTSKAQVTRDAPAWFHPGRSATLRLGPKTVLAHFGALHPETLKLMDVAAPAAAFEVFLDAIPAEKRKATRARPLFKASDLLPLQRDFAFILDHKVAAGDVVRAAIGADKALIKEVGVFDLYEGKNVGEGKKSLAIQVTIQPTDRTLTDEEIEAVAKKVVSEVKRTTGGEIRG